MKIPESYKQLFEPELLNELEQKASLVSVKEGDTILDIGQTVRIMPIVLSGTIKVSRIDESGRELLLYYISPNESCAMTITCCMQQYPSEIKATAEEEVSLLAIPIQMMDEWLAKYPTWKSFVMKTIRTRFHELMKTIDQIAFQNLDDRLVIYLREKSKISHSTLVNLSHEEIATDLATSRVVISRLLKKLELDGRVLLYRNQVKLLKSFLNL